MTSELTTTTAPTAPDPQPTLHSARLTLRPFTLSDAQDVQRLAGDARVADTTIAVPHPYPAGAAQASIATHAEAFAARREITFAIVPRDDAALLGAVSLVDIAGRHARAELGYWVGVPYWGQGYGTEDVQRLIQYAHKSLQLTRITARCMLRNAASARVMAKAGLQREGLLPSHLRVHGVYEDILIYGLCLPGRGSD